MIGVLLFTHGSLCNVLRVEAERLAGHRDHVVCVSMREDESYEELHDRVLEIVDRLDTGEGILALVDVAGGTPWNLCGQISRDRDHRIVRIGGGGMPLVIKALQDHGEHHDLEAWAAELAEYAHNRLVAG
jgi:mannose/fructose-specific phosphotransferase system component IIA